MLTVMRNVSHRGLVNIYSRYLQKEMYVYNTPCVNNVLIYTHLGKTSYLLKLP